MSKILAVSDIHIHDYPHRNPGHDQYYRLHQGSRTVADNILKAGKDCDYIVIAGDVIEKSILRPYVISEVHSFLKKVMTGFKKGWIIWGNHDMDNKSSSQEISDSCLAVLLPDNLEYAHQKEINLEGLRIGFNNWQPEFDLSWISGKLDYLFTHARICYSGESELFQSQELDETKFDLAFCGDIHRPGKIGKYVSIGIPQRCKMSDGTEATGIILDCTSRTWDWVNLNPDDNLMKFQYTSSQDKEGWDSATGTWNVYRRDPVTSSNIPGQLDVSGWSAIEELVNDTIQKSGMKDIHSHVLSNIKNLDAGEVDFNFSLCRFYCKNWRSIEEVEMFFSEGDRILLQGGNGSGKSSLLSALKYAFCTPRYGGLSSLKSFIQFGAKSCVTEVEFFYQSVKYKIRRGTESKDCGLWINDEPQKYGSKADFEKDCERRFPFTKYIDVLIHDQDHNQFIGSKSGEYLAEVISKTFKLDKIDTYNDTARSLLDQAGKDSGEKQTKLSETQRLLEFIGNKLSGISLPQYSKSDLVRFHQEGLELQKAAETWNRYLTETSMTRARLESMKENLVELQSASFRPDTVIDKEISDLTDRLTRLQAEQLELSGVSEKLRLKKTEESSIVSEGKRLRAEYDSIDPGAISSCPTCKQEIPKNPETIKALETKKEKLGSIISEITERYRSVRTEISSLEYQVSQVSEKVSDIKREIMEINSEVSGLIAEKTRAQEVSNRIERIKTDIGNLENYLESLGQPEQVELPDDFMSKMSEFSSGIKVWEEYESGLAESEKYSKQYELLKTELESFSVYSDSLKNYIKLTGPTGIVYKEVMERLTSQFNDNQVNYDVELSEYRRVMHLTLTPKFNNNGNWVPYAACSGGQKTVLDVHFLSKIIGRTGLLVMDEFFKHLDPGNHDLCIEIISGMNVGCTMISSHMESIQAFNNKTCRLSLSGVGKTLIEFN